MTQVTVKKPIIIGLTCLSILIILAVHYTYTTQPRHRSPPPSCLRPTDIEHLLDILNSSNHEVERPTCYKEVKCLMDLIYRVELSGTDVTVPDSMEGLVRDNWFAGDTSLYEKFQHPRIITVTDRYTYQTTTVNPIRAMRPKPAGNGEILEEIKRMIEESKPGCNFCNSHQTLEDTFGRIMWEKANIYTAENAFRFYDYTGMVIPGDIHNYMDIDYQTFDTMLTYSAVTWFGNIHEGNPSKTHPVLVWDLLAKAGASQVHPHIQLIMGSGSYPGKFGQIDEARRRYKTDTGGDYLQDIVDLHIALGLGFKHRTSAVIVPINPTKDREIWVIGKDNIFDWTWLYFIAFRSYIEELEVYCFSQAMAMPTSIINAGNAGELMIAKLGSRGDCTSSYNDVSSLELYSINSISTDYFETASAVYKTYQKYANKG